MLSAKYYTCFFWEPPTKLKYSEAVESSFEEYESIFGSHFY